MKNRKLNFETLQIHAGHTPDKETRSRAVPIYQTTSYTFRDAAHAADLFELKEAGNIYTRIQNPTSEVLEKRIASLEGGTGSLAVASGHAAQFIAVSTLMTQGDNLVSSPFLYGGTFNQFKVTLKNHGIEARFSSNLEPASFERLIDENTKLLYLESIGNPGFNIPDLEKFGALASKYNIPLVVDNTFGAAGYLVKPIEYGANIVVESATKWIGGHGTSIGGIITDGGNFNWANGKFLQFTEPSEGYHGLKFWDEFGEGSKHGNIAFITKARVEALRDYGPSISPFNSFLLLQGLETLSLRMERHVENTQKVAEWLQARPEVDVVNYPGLPGDAQNAMARKYTPKGAGGVLSFSLVEGKEKAMEFINRLELISHLANIGDARTLIIQPAATTHKQLSEDEQLAAGVSPSLMRLSVGLEHIDDIIGDIEQALKG